MDSALAGRKNIATNQDRLAILFQLSVDATRELLNQILGNPTTLLLPAEFDDRTSLWVGKIGGSGRYVKDVRQVLLNVRREGELAIGNL